MWLSTVTGLRWWGRFGSVVERAGCFAATRPFAFVDDMATIGGDHL